MKKLLLGVMAVGAFMAFSTSAMASVNTHDGYVQTQNDDDSKCGSGKCGGDDGKCGTGKCGGK